LTEQTFRFVIRNIDDSKCNRSPLDYSPFKILKNNADLEAKAHFCIIAEHIQDQLAVHDFIAKE
jgi:hypothetical protein